MDYTARAWAKKTTSEAETTAPDVVPYEKTPTKIEPMTYWRHKTLSLSPSIFQKLNFVRWK